jgi:hypothetical protein
MVTLTINDHREEIKRHWITIGNSPIIVGLPWLWKHNPNINRKEGRITFDSEKCGKTCLATSPHATTITEKRAAVQYEQSTGRSWEKAYAIVSRPHEETKRENPELAQQTTMDNKNQKHDEEEEGFRIQEAWEEYVEDEEEVEQSRRSQDHTNKQGEVKHAGSTEDEDDPERPTLRQTPEAPNISKKTTSPKTPKRAQKILEIMSSETGGKLHNPTTLTNHKTHTHWPEEVVPGEYHDYLSVFREKEAVRLPPHRYHDHHIPLLEGKVPPFEPLWALDEDRLRVLRDYLEENEKWGWIRQSTSMAGAPIHFVKKKDGTLWLCVDYRWLNDITIKDRTPLPLIGEALDRLSNANMYTKLDVRDAYHNLRIAMGDEWKTAFRTKYSLYEYRVMPFGLTNARASFQQWMNEVLSDYLDVFCIAYLDDILIYSDSLEEHQRHVREVLQQLKEVGLTLKPSKYEFHTDRMEYLSYIISPMGIQMDPEKIKTVKDWKEPVNIKGIQSFLGFANF